MPITSQLQSYTTRLGFALLSCYAATAYSQGQVDATAGAIDSGQSLTLFEEVETPESRGRTTGRPTREARVTTAQPEFTLMGVSRIGGKYSALLQDKGGESLIVRADPGANTVIPNHSGYSIVDVTASSVSIRYPGNNPCVEFTDRGVSCNSAANIAELVLANAEPLANRNPTVVDVVEESSGIVVIEPQGEPSNPFEALRNGRRSDTVNAAGTDTTAAGRFTPRRINPADVPEGKRIVATPFGDRLVDE